MYRHKTIAPVPRFGYEYPNNQPPGGVSMKRLGVWVVAINMLGAVFASAQPGTVTIKAEKHFAGTRDGADITAGKNIDKLSRDLFYTFDVRSMAPQPADLTAEWVILVKTMKGRLRTVSDGRETLTLQPGETKTVETPMFALREESGPKGKTAKGEIEGIGVRVTDANGVLVGSLFEPATQRQQIEEAFSGNVPKRKNN
jgi:hypothetical protein